MILRQELIFHVTQGLTAFSIQVLSQPMQLHMLYKSLGQMIVVSKTSSIVFFCLLTFSCFCQESFHGIVHYSKVVKGDTVAAQTLYCTENAILFCKSEKMQQYSEGFTKDLLLVTDSGTYWYRINPTLKTALRELWNKFDCGDMNLDTAANGALLYGKWQSKEKPPEVTIRIHSKIGYTANLAKPLLKPLGAGKCLPYFSLLNGYLIARFDSEIRAEHKNEKSITYISGLLPGKIDASLWQIPADYAVETFSWERYGQLIAKYRFGININQ